MEDIKNILFGIPSKIKRQIGNINDKYQHISLQDGYYHVEEVFRAKGINAMIKSKNTHENCDAVKFLITVS